MSFAPLNILRRTAGSKFTRNGALVFGAILAGNVFNYLYYLQMGRTLSVSDYGAVMSLLSGVLLVLGIGGVTQTVTAKLAADLRASGDLGRIAAFTRVISRVSIWVGAGIALVALASQELVATYLRIDSALLLTVASATTGFGFIILFQRGLFQGLGEFRTFGISSTIDGVKAFLIFPLTHFLGAAGCVVAMFAAAVAATVYGTLEMHRNSRRASRAVHLDMRRMIVTAAMTGLPSLSIIVLMFYDVVLARHFLNPTDAGLYGAAALTGRIVFTVISFLPTILLPHVSHGAAKGHSQTHLLYGALSGAALLVGLIAFVSGFAPALVIYVLAGARFLSATPIVLPYVLASGALALANVLAVYAIACHRFRFVPYILLISLCEIVLVCVRHGSSLDIVTDILTGHAAALCVMAISTALDLVHSRPQVGTSAA